MSLNNIVNSGNVSPSWVNLRANTLVVDGTIGFRILQTNAITQFLNPPTITPVLTTSSELKYSQFGQFIFLSLNFAQVTTLATSAQIKIFGFDDLVVPITPQVTNILIEISGEFHNTSVSINFDLNGVYFIILPPATLPNFPATTITLPQQTIMYLLT